MKLRFLPVTPNALLIEAGDLDQTLALYDALVARPVPGVGAIIPAARTILIRTVPGVAADGRLAARIMARRPAPGAAPAAPAGGVIELPLSYDGEDLDAVAARLGLDRAGVIAAHQAVIWQVAFCGFSPGFAYMICDDPRFDLPRRAVPRRQIPPGSVALAGRFCGIYPQATPGGWQLIGRTEAPLWDLSRDPPALLRPGMGCRFVARGGKVYRAGPVPGPAGDHAAAAAGTPAPLSPCPPAQRDPQGAGGLQILSTAFAVLIQDEGRPGQTGQGISGGGALDIGALWRANRAVGNPSDAPALEITLGPLRLRALGPLVLAQSGAGRARLAGRELAVGAGFAMDAGDELEIPAPAAGMRSYLALRGGFEVARVLGSASRDTLAAIGPAPLEAGAVLLPAHHRAGAVGVPVAEPALPAPGDLVRLKVTLGPRTGCFSAAEVEDFLTQEWMVTADISRVGMRLEGPRPLLRADGAELASEGVETGAVQIPHSGQPVLFLADHPLTGGYPVIAVLHPDARDLAAQIPPGARIRFVASAPFAPIHPQENV
ncbi:MAG: urea amidolyase family protein [Paracoccus sp. (in: a-proteobacteria)]|nr:urea amidolyase family protein [Paracoccus sp. (in: a-proteobacteria)]